MVSRVLNIRQILPIVIAFFCATNLFAQSADVDMGCVPLTVRFDAPDLSAYFWDFKDGASSDLKSPEHTYITPGIYLVELFEGAAGSKQGEILISVFAKPIVEITGDPRGGCSPLNVEFTSLITKDDDIEILDYVWTFGDGLSSTVKDPAHVYNTDGIFPVSLQIKTEPPQCGVTEIFTDFIEVDKVKAFFRLDLIAACEAPATFTIVDISADKDGNVYLWDFGNGQTSSAYNPGAITYTSPGVYKVSFTVTNSSGCMDTHSVQVTIGKPIIDIDAHDTVCIGVPVAFINNTNAGVSQWTFGNGAIPSASNSRIVEVIFNTPGAVEVTLTTFSFTSCKSDTSFTVFVDVANANFTLDPMISCLNPLLIAAEAENKVMSSYLWNDTMPGGANEIITYQCPVRDSLHINRLDTVFVKLLAITSAGCRDTVTHFSIQRKPDAYFLTSVPRGCAPLNVTFKDSSLSFEPIVSWTWIYGDGNQTQFSSGGSHSYVYSQPGEYYVRLVVENNAGCIDTSNGMWVFVGEKIIPEYNIDKTEICLGDTINIDFTNTDPRIDAWHFDSDENRFDYCWTNQSGAHAFVTEPGIFDVTTTIDYNGCLTSVTEANVITVNGAKAKISYMINCDSPFEVMLWNQSLGADQFQWSFPPSETSDLDSLVYEYSSTGVYTIYLEALDTDNACPLSLDSAEIHIRDIKANFTMDTLICDNQSYILDASSSIDVDDDCSKGYLWILPNNRPREVSVNFIEHVFPPGKQDVTLVVESINGCTDTITKSLTAFGITPSFAMDKTRICDPGEVNFLDQSLSDTTITDYSWSFGKAGPEVSNIFSNFSDPPEPITIVLQLTDAIGCIDEVSRQLFTYIPESGISVNPGLNACAGDTLQFSATDFTEEGSFLNFDWQFGNLGNSDLQNPKYAFPASGLYPVVLTFTEDASGCMGTDTVEINVVRVPEASYITDVDGVDPLCHPAIIQFTNTSETEGPISYYWIMENGLQTSLKNPAAAFPKGSYGVTLIVSSPYGCADTTSDRYTLVGPEGTFIASDDVICKGNEITFTLQDTVDVGTFTWDFGDGMRASNVDPVTHIYDFNPPGGSTIVTLVLESGETGCTLEDSVSIRIVEVFADFNSVDSLQYCQGKFAFTDQSSGATSWLWNFGDGQNSTEQNPVNIYGSPGPYSVMLEVVDDASGCTGEVSKEIEVEFKDYIFIPNAFTPNRDSRNDFFTPVVLPGYEDFVEVKEFRIYNRWGNLLYDNETPEDGWDGTNYGANAPATVYAYFISVEILDCTTLSFKGNVTLIR